jgi:hypothetical protein
MSKLESQIDLTDFARQFDRYLRCKAKNDETNTIDAKAQIKGMLQLLPFGSGIDKGIKFDWDNSKPNKLVFNFSFHHMKDGYYNGWTDHKLILTPSFTVGYDMRISGKDKNDIKDHLHDVFSTVFFY